MLSSTKYHAKKKIHSQHTTGPPALTSIVGWVYVGEMMVKKTLKSAPSATQTTIAHYLMKKFAHTSTSVTHATQLIYVQRYNVCHVTPTFTKVNA